MSEAADSKSAKQLMEAISKQLDGTKLPDLKSKELEGVRVVMEVKNGRLNWSHVVGVEMKTW